MQNSAVTITIRRFEKRLGTNALLAKKTKRLIDRFEKTATEFFVNLESRPDDLIGLIVQCRCS